MIKQREREKPVEPEIVLTGIWGFLSKKLGIPPWGQILAAVLFLVFGVIVLGFRLLNSKIDDLAVDQKIKDNLAPLSGKVDGLAQRIFTIEGEIKVLLAQKSLVAFGRYAKEGKTELAAKAAQQATSTLASATADKVPAPPEYFVDTIEIINGVAKVVPSPQLSGKLQAARLSLAEYRSALLVGKITYTQKLTFSPMKHAFDISNRDVTMEGGYFDASTVTGDLIAVVPPLKGLLAEGIRIQGAIISGGFQTLDGIHWSGVTFIGTHIRYHGGQVDLDHVTFVGCKFNAPNNDQGAQFADYVALMLPKLRIG